MNKKNHRLAPSKLNKQINLIEEYYGGKWMEFVFLLMEQERLPGESWRELLNRKFDEKFNFLCRSAVNKAKFTKSSEYRAILTRLGLL